MKPASASHLYLDERLPDQWVVRDPEGAFWVLPSAPDGWEQRQPYAPDDPASLQPVPAHYQALLGVPGNN